MQNFHVGQIKCEPDDRHQMRSVDVVIQIAEQPIASCDQFGNCSFSGRRAFLFGDRAPQTLQQLAMQSANEQDDSMLARFPI